MNASWNLLTVAFLLISDKAEALKLLLASAAVLAQTGWILSWESRCFTVTRSCGFNTEQM